MSASDASSAVIAIAGLEATIMILCLLQERSMAMVSFSVPHALAKRRLGMLASDFEDLVQYSSDGKPIQIGALRSHHDGLLVISAHLLQHCLQEQQDVNDFVSNIQLTIGSEPSVLEERKAIQAAAQRGCVVLTEWIKLLEVE